MRYSHYSWFRPATNLAPDWSIPEVSAISLRGVSTRAEARRSVGGQVALQASDDLGGLVVGVARL
jgi:hypothetical protein